MDCRCAADRGAGGPPVTFGVSSGSTRGMPCGRSGSTTRAADPTRCRACTYRGRPGCSRTLAPVATGPCTARRDRPRPRSGPPACVSFTAAGSRSLQPAGTSGALLPATSIPTSSKLSPGIDGRVGSCQAWVHLSTGPLHGASPRGLSTGPLHGASPRGLSTGPLHGASPRGLSTGPLHGASPRGLSTGPLHGASPRGLSTGPLHGASPRGLSTGPLHGASR